MEAHMKKALFLSMPVALAMIAAALGDGASARTSPAVLGQPAIGSTEECFNYNNNSLQFGSVKKIACPAPVRSFFIPLIIENSGQKSVLFSSRATTAGASCRARSNNSVGNEARASSPVAVPVSTVFVGQSTGSILVPSGGLFFLHCDLNDDSEVLMVNYPP
jgi:hypothetical protein